MALLPHSGAVGNYPAAFLLAVAFLLIANGESEVMQGNVADLVRELMELQQLSVRKVSARIAENHGGSVYGYTQQVSRILNDPTYDPTLSTVQKILSALNVSLWQVSRAPNVEPRSQLQQLNDRFDQLSSDVAFLKSELINLQQSIAAIADAVAIDRAGSHD